MLHPKDRPSTLHGLTERVRTAHGNLFISLTWNGSPQPFEVFTHLGKAGSCDSAYLEAISRLVSLALRSGIDVREIIEQLQGISCHPFWDQGVQVLSAPDAIAKVLKKHSGAEPDSTPSVVEAPPKVEGGAVEAEPVLVRRYEERTGKAWDGVEL